jgi:hypothetical protein
MPTPFCAFQNKHLAEHKQHDNIGKISFKFNYRNPHFTQAFNAIRIDVGLRWIIYLPQTFNHEFHVVLLFVLG